MRWTVKDASTKTILVRAVFLLLVLSTLLIAAICFWNAVKWVDKPFSGFLLTHRMRVGYIGQPHWTGTLAGLRYPDTILRADGQPVSTIRDVERVIANTRIGDPVRYEVRKEVGVVHVEVPTMRFTLADLLMTFGIVYSLGIVYLIIAVVVFILKPDAAAGIVFSSACLLQSISSIISFDLESTHFGFIRAYLFNEAMLPALIVHLSHVFPEKSSLAERRPYLAYAGYVLSLVLFVPLEALYPHSAAFDTFYAVALFYAIVSVFLFVIATLRSFLRNRSALARQRAKVVLIGAAVALPLPAIAPLVAFVGGTLGGMKVFSNFSSIPILIFPASIAYAIAKHNLFDVDVFIKRAVGYAIMTAIVGAAYLGLQIGLETFVLAPVFGTVAHKFTPLLFAVLVVFLFNPLNRRIQDAVDRMFFRKKFDYKTTVTAVSDALSSVLNLDEIVRKIVGTIHSEMFINRSGLILVGAGGQDSRGYFMGAVGGENGAPERKGKDRDAIRRTQVLPEDPLVGLIAREKKLVTKYDVAEDPHYAHVRESCGDRFEELGASMAIPVLYQGEVKGILVVGQKKSGQFYTREDVELLTTLASHGAVAIENANLAEQMKKEETVRTNLSRYLSPQIVDRIVKHDVEVNLGGDRKVVTILFSDIRNFTTITETRPPDQLVTILNEYFTEMAKIIFEHQGSLDKYIGDAIVAVFGSLVPLENSARNAVEAAVEMMRRLPELNRRWEARYGFYMNIGIGVNTGEVFLGNIGSPERMEFTVIGDAVNVASRFSGIAKAGQVLVTRETRALLGPDVRVTEHPPAEVKGKTGKLEVFEILYAQSMQKGDRNA